MNEAIYEALIQKKLTSTLNVEEQHLLANWLSENIENQKFKEAVEEAWNLSRNYENQFEPDRTLALKKLKDRIRASKAASTTSLTKVIPIKKSRRIWAAAAAIIILLGVFSVWDLLTKDPLEWQRIATNEEISEKVILSDGTSIWLNKDSQLEFPKSFKGSKRIVKFNGEAFFEVNNDAKKPFIIEGNGSRVEVIGTSFNLKDREGQSPEISVKSGEVAFSKIDESISQHLTANKTAVLDNQAIQVFNDLNLNALSWHTGQLSFNGTPLKKVLLDFNEHFNTNITLENTDMNSCHFTSPIVKSDLDLALQRLEKVFKFKIRQNDASNILLVGGKCD